MRSSSVPLLRATACGRAPQSTLAPEWRLLGRPRQRKTARAALVMDEVDDLVLGVCPRCEARDTELQFHLDGRRIDGLQGNGWRGILDDASTGFQHCPHRVLDDARPLP